MIVGIGTDIVANDRVGQLYKKQGSRFTDRLLTKNELLEFSESLNPERFLAKRWAVKEAVSKALGTGISGGISFSQMEVCHYESGQPYIELSGFSKEYSESLGVTDWHVSVSDERDYSIAYVLAESHK
jgi:holo-[acyl-carrier protein] synthase